MLSVDKINKLKEENAMLQAYKDVNEDFKTAWAELKAENDRLKEEVKEVKKYQYEQEFLEKEIERLKEEIREYKKHSKCAWKCFEGTLCEEGEKYKTCLQEIKTIAEANQFDFAKGSIISYQTIKEVAKNFEKILELTKAEEE